MSDLDFNHLILFLGGVSSTVRINQSLDIFDITNIPSTSLDKKKGLIKESKLKTNINNSDLTDIILIDS